MHKRIIGLLICVVLAFSAFGCNKNPENNDPNTYVDAEVLEIIQPSQIVAADEIGQLPAHPTLPSVDTSKAPYAFQDGKKGTSFDISRTNNKVTAEYERLPTSWDYFYIDIANWQSDYPYVSFIFEGNTTVTYVTVAASYAEMGSNPLVPLLVDALMRDYEPFYLDISSFVTINSAYEKTTDLLCEKTIDRLYFFIDSNPAQNPINEEGSITVDTVLTKFHPQRPMWTNKTPTQNASHYTLGTNEGGKNTIFRSTTTANDMANAYVEFEIDDYIVIGSEYFDLSVEFSAAFTRSVSIAAVFEGGDAGWRDYAILKTYNTTSGNASSGASNWLSGDYGDVLNLATAPIRTLDGTIVADEFVSAYKVTKIRLYIDSGAGTYADGATTTAAGTLSNNQERLVTINDIDFRIGAMGVRIGKGWFLQENNSYMTLNPATIEMGGVGVVTVSGKGGWNWFAMPVSDFEIEAKFITIKFSGPTEKLHLGVELNFQHAKTGSLAYKVVNGSAGLFNYEDTVLPNYPYERTISYDRATDTYTFTVDLTGSDLDNPNLILNEIRIYLNDPDAATPDPGIFDVEFKGVTVTIPKA